MRTVLAASLIKTLTLTMLAITIIYTFSALRMTLDVATVLLSLMLTMLTILVIDEIQERTNQK